MAIVIGALVAVFAAIFVALTTLATPQPPQNYLRRVAKKYGISPLNLRG